MDELVIEQRTPAPVTVPIWAWMIALLALAAVWLVTLENGLLLSAGAENLHELFHDARHAIGFPCH